MYDRLQLTNMLRSEVERIPETGLPLEVFPARIQELVLNLARYENFNVEYTASSCCRRWRRPSGTPTGSE